MDREPQWSLHGGPEVIGADRAPAWTAWSWQVARAGELRDIGVYVAAAALDCDPAGLDPGTAAARESKGRTAVEQMLGMPDPFPVVVCVRAGLRHQSQPPPPARDPDAAPGVGG